MEKKKLFGKPLFSAVAAAAIVTGSFAAASYGLSLKVNAEEAGESELYSVASEVQPGLGSIYDVAAPISNFGLNDNVAFAGSYKSQLDAVSARAYESLYEIYGSQAIEGKYSLGISGTVEGVSVVDGEFTAESEAKILEWAGNIVTPAFLALVYDHPELSWICSVKYGYSVSSISISGSDAIIGDIQFYLADDTSDTGTLDDIQTAAASAKSAINTEIGNSTVRYDIVKGIHDYLCENIEYNDTAADDDQTEYTEEQLRCYQTAYSAFYECNEDDGIYTVCAGYARGFKVLCDSYGIPCVYVSGDAGTASFGGHAWNYVQMEDGKWYAVDVTWDDQGETDGVNDTRTEYFLSGSDTIGFAQTRFEESHIESGNWTTNELNTMLFIYPEIESDAYVYTEGSEECDHSGAAYNDNGDGTHTLACGECGERLAEPHSYSNGECACGLICGTCGADGDNLKWTLVDGTLTISGTGAMADGQAWSAYINNISAVVIESGVTYVGKGAFEGIASNATVNVPCSWNEKPLYEFEDGIAVNIANHNNLTYSVNSVGNVISEKCGVCKNVSGTLTLTAEDFIYDGNSHSAALSQEGTLADANVEIEYFKAAVSLGNTIPENAGTYTAKVTYGGQTASVQFTINKTDAVVTAAPTPVDRVYDGTEKNLINEGTATGGEMQYSLEKNGKYSTAIPTGTNAGTYTVWYKVVGDENHNDTVPVSVKVTIARKPAVVTADDTGKTYGDNDPVFSYNVPSGLVTGDALIGTLTRETGEDAGTYEITQGTLTNENNPNYDITFTNGIFTINKAAPAELASPTATQITYGQSLSASALSDSSWSWTDGTVVPSVTNSGFKAVVSVDDKNYDYTGVDGYENGKVARTVAVTVNKAKPVITVTAVPASDVAGKAVKVTAAAANPYNSALKDIPAPTLTYKIGDGAEKSFTGSFVIPADTAANTKITITAKTAANSNYEAGTGATTVVVAEKAVITSATPGNASVTVKWNAVKGAEKYRVFYYLNGKYTTVKDVTATSYTVTGLTNGTKYGFLVRAYVGGAWTGYTAADVVYATPVAPVIGKPVISSAVAGDRQVTLKWNAVSGAETYRVFYYLNGKYATAANTTATSYTVKNLTNGTKYGFLVRAYANGVWSTYTTADNVYATPVAPVVVKPVVTAYEGNAKVRLEWTKINGATKYAIYTYSGGKYTLYKNTTLNYYNVTGLTNGTKMGFLVRAYVNGKWTAFTSADIVYATPVDKPAVTAYAGNGKVRLNWGKVSGATKYAIYTYSGGKYTLYRATTANAYNVTGLTNGTSYTFLVRAYVNGKWTAFNVYDRVSAAPVDKPVITKAVAADGRVRLYWNKVAGATKYAVYTYSGGKYSVYKYTTANAYTVSGLTNDTSYGFLVRAYVNGKWTTYNVYDRVTATPKK